ncbi:response regulator [Bradyrhizobium ontarionense]|uniref:Response regulator n=1 Tax=Bradyrhizobium ontarionense TaxID=2898149 RepID=A0ABY3RM87_9BRAD|nr:response regulator [Bradyrhizobium sp. A19]UFZ07977.1 response regulator [Bradyrhizobium sp. A19]
MTNIRTLHVDDEPDIREVVEISLSLDPAFLHRSCESGADALAAAEEWGPDIILLDVMMPVMDGPATLRRLQQNPETAGIPVVFMTARAQSREIDHFRALGAVGVIAKPFDPMTLAATVRSFLQPPTCHPLKDRRAGFLCRVQRDLALLLEGRDALKAGAATPHMLDQIRHIANGLSGAGGIYGYVELSNAAAALEDAAIAEIAGDGSDATLSSTLDELIVRAGAGDLEAAGVRRHQGHAPGAGTRTPGGRIDIPTAT